MADQQKRQIEIAGNVPATQQAVRTEDVAEIDLAELFFRLLDHWKAIFFTALLFAIVAAVITVFFITPKYHATSTIYVLSRRDSAINMSDLQIGTALTADYVKVFDMWEVHEKVISNLDLPYTYAQMRKKLSVTNTSNTRMLDITFSSVSPDEAKNVANEYARVASNYIAETMSTDRPNIMSAARTPTQPYSPSKVRNTALGFILGFLLASAIVTVRYIMDDKYKTAEDVRKYAGLNMLAVIPDEDMDDNSDRKSGRSRRRDNEDIDD